MSLRTSSSRACTRVGGGAYATDDNSCGDGCEHGGGGGHGDVDWSVFDPFWIDDGELGGLSAEQAFVLGVEWALVRARIDSGEEFTQPVHSANAVRLLNLAESRGRHAEFAPFDKQNDWGALAIFNYPPTGGGTLLPRSLEQRPGDRAMPVAPAAWAAGREGVAPAQCNLPALTVRGVNAALLALLGSPTAHCPIPFENDRRPVGQPIPPHRETGRRSSGLTPSRVIRQNRGK